MIAGTMIQLMFAAVVGANILAMSLMNFFEMPTQHLPVIYSTCMLAIGALMARKVPQLPQLTKREHLFCIGFTILIFLPRFPVLIENVLGFSVNVVGDDVSHLQMMSSIAHSPAFPPRSTFDSSKYLGYYYAPWMLGAAFYRAGFVSTVKQALALSVLVYSLFFSYGVTYASKVLFKEARLQTILLVVCVMYGGFDFFYWLSGLTFIPSHSEWWAGEFGIYLEYSNFFTLVLWVQQHTLAALAILYAMFLTDRSSSISTAVLTGIFVLSAFFSSVFVFIGAIPIVAWWCFSRAKFPQNSVVTELTFLLFSIPLWWIYLGKYDGSGIRLFGALEPFWATRKRAAFLVFLLVLSLELMPLLAASYLTIVRERIASRYVLFALCTLFLLSTFMIEFGQGANYPMRGSIIPIFTLSYLATPTISEWFRDVRSTALRLLIAGYLLGGVSEYASFCRYSLIALADSKTEFNTTILQFNQGASQLSSADLGVRLEHMNVKCAPDAYCWDGTYFWYLIERDSPPKLNIDEGDMLTMGSDNKYRVTVSSIGRLYARWAGPSS